MLAMLVCRLNLPCWSNKVKNKPFFCLHGKLLHTRHTECILLFLFANDMHDEFEVRLFFEILSCLQENTRKKMYADELSRTVVYIDNDEMIDILF